jgi:hypothetical protein
VFLRSSAAEPESSAVREPGKKHIGSGDVLACYPSVILSSCCKAKIKNENKDRSKHQSQLPFGHLHTVRVYKTRSRPSQEGAW